MLLSVTNRLSLVCLEFAALSVNADTVIPDRKVWAFSIVFLASADVVVELCNVVITFSKFLMAFTAASPRFSTD